MTYEAIKVGNYSYIKDKSNKLKYSNLVKKKST